MRILPNIVGTALGFVLLASGIGAAHAGKAGKATTTAPNCISPTLDAAGEGRRAFLRLNCYSCHGMHGTGGMGPNLVGEGSDDVSEAVLYGEEGGMPSFKGYLCTNDVTYLQAYLRSLGTSAEPTFTHWWEPVPSQ